MFGNTAKYRAYTDDYVKKHGETVPSDTPEPSPSQDGESGGAPDTLVIVCISAFAVVLIAAAAVVLARKKK